MMPSILVLPPALYGGNPFSTAGSEILILALFGRVFSGASILLSAGSKLLPSSEAAWMSKLAVPRQPVLAWAVLSELPPHATFVGGALDLLAICAWAWPSRARP
jgi:hypothetical protein